MNRVPVCLKYNQNQLEKVQQKHKDAEKKLFEVREAGEGAWKYLKPDDAI